MAGLIKQILRRCLAEAGADARQFLGRCWVHDGRLLGRSWADAGNISRSTPSLSALPVPMLSQVFWEVFWVLFSLPFLSRF